MRAAAAFDEVLDEALRGLPVEPAMTGGFSRAGNAASYGFFFVGARAVADADPLAAAGATPCRRGHRTPCQGVQERADLPVRLHGHRFWTGEQPDLQNCVGDRGERASATTGPFGERSPLAGPAAHTPRRQPARRLSSQQRAALAELVELGAPLDESFTDAQLRSAFRSLARRYHPDRHARGTQAEKAELSLMFSRLREAYQKLVAIADN